ncbi:hypothetical protein TCAL_10393 [Tigriopus californicus]|uniref:Kinase n=1 Tax=Tigriopus californicus TaxID=6832 RepID=A0A553P2A6_TIGCA|nr:hypothetical protein TCAL_10393 [Tigriopus californicus]
MSGDNFVKPKFNGDSKILEAIMAEKMSQATTNFLRSNSVHSVDSTCSTHSYTSGLSDSDRCSCDDCVLGITDFLLDFSQTKIPSNEPASSTSKPKSRKCVQSPKSGQRRRSLRKGREKLFDILLPRNNGATEDQKFTQSVSWSRIRFKNPDKASASGGGSYQVCCIYCKGVRRVVDDERRCSDPFQFSRVLTSDQRAELIELIETHKGSDNFGPHEDDILEQPGVADAEAKKSHVDQAPTRQRMSSPSFFRRTKKLSVPNLSLGTSSSSELSSSPKSCPRSVPQRSKGARKKLSLASSPVPVFCFGASPFDDDYKYEDDTDAVKCLESAARKISRGSPSRSPNRHSSPRMGGLVGLARGYEQYRESLRYLTPTVEYGEASSDDLSSEWESSDVEGNNNRSFTKRLALLTSLPPGTIQEADPERSGNLLTVPNTDPQFFSLDEKQDVSHSHKSTHVAKAAPDPSSKKSYFSKRPSGWRKLRRMVQWTPFIQTYKNRRYQWVQLAGHSGNFKAGKNQGTVLKKLCVQEELCYQKFENDELAHLVPKYQGILTLDDDEKFIQLQDCLSSFSNPSIMDCKIGVRTYLEEELAKAKENPKLRRDMYDKMIAVDSDAPTEEEHKLKGVTKPRYMVWRETISSTATLGFRIEGVKMSDGSSSKEFKTTKTRDQVFEAFKRFLALNPKKALIGSSLLFVHDNQKASIWLIDFGKTVPLPEGHKIDHKSPWEVGNHEDGYLIGIDNLINIMEQLVNSDAPRIAVSSDERAEKSLITLTTSET